MSYSQKPASDQALDTSDSPETLLFSLGQAENTRCEFIVGLDISLVRGVIYSPSLMHSPDLPNGVEGTVALRDTNAPAVNLAKLCGVATSLYPEVLVVYEYAGRLIGLLGNSIENVKRLPWSHAEDLMVTVPMQMQTIITAVSDFREGCRAMLLDVPNVSGIIEHLPVGEHAYLPGGEKERPLIVH